MDLENYHIEKNIVRLVHLKSDKIIKFRRKFHMMPELELDCYETSKAIKEELLKCGLEVESGLANTGVVGILKGGKSGPVIALRFDIDALPITENTGLSFASKIEGKMHACGHDGHTAIGLGLVNVFAEMKDSICGTIKFIFQPGEEDPGGAKIMIKEGVLKKPKVDAILGFHIFPGIKFGKVGVRYGIMTAGDDDFTITLKGVGGHGGHPDKTKDPIVAAAYFITAVQTISSRSVEPIEPLVISICEINGGKGYNVIPDSVTLRGTIRTTSDKTAVIAQKRIKDILKGIKYSFGVEYSINIIHEANPLKCDKRLAAFFHGQLKSIIGDDNITLIDAPSMGADDFADYTYSVPGIYLRLGSYNEKSGNIHMLHTSKFDFDEELLINNTAILAQLIKNYLSSYYV